MTAADPAPPAFIVNRAVVDRTEATNPELVFRYFNQPSAYATSNAGLSQCTPNATCAVSFADETNLEAAISQGTLPPVTGAVLYDCEAWIGTPPNQQQHPGYWYQRAGNAAYAAGLTLVATPGTDLANVVNPGSGPMWRRFLASYIAKQAARGAAVYDVQAQAYQGDLATYSDYVHQAAKQALAGNPDVTIIAGLTTNHQGVVYTAQQMLDAAQAVQDVVSGYWLNDPAGGPQNPGGVGPAPQVVVDFLSNLCTIGY